MSFFEEYQNTHGPVSYTHLFMGLANAPYGFQMFLTASFVTALPGILIQIIVIPLLVLALQKAGFLTRD